MGTWGYELEQDDFFFDVTFEFEQQLKQNQNLQQTTDLIIEAFNDELDDPDEGPLFWIALASMQWKYGKVDDAVLTHVKSDFERNAGLERWLDIGQKEYERRKKVIAAFVEKVSTENLKPKKLPKLVVRKPVFLAGDCLSIELSNGLYGAGLVLAADHSDIENGKNLIGVLNFMENEKPDISVFQKRDWLVITHHQFDNQPDFGWYTAPGFRRVKSNIHIVGNIAIVSNDPPQSNRYITWEQLGSQVVYQQDWNQAH